MQVLVVGASGVIGSAVADVFATRHTVLRASRSRSPIVVDLSDIASIREMFSQVGRVDLVLCAAGQAAFAPFSALAEPDYASSFANKLMGQVNLVRVGLDYMNDGGAFVLCGGVVSRSPIPGGTALSIVNAGLEGFARAVSLELPRGLRVNVVAPGWVRETSAARNVDPRLTVPASAVAQAYITAAATKKTGQVFDV